METLSKSFIVIFAGILLTSCASPPPPPTPTPTLEPTPIPPTSTSEPTPTSTLTPKPTPTRIPSTPTREGFLLPLPTGAPVSSWHGIRIMPGALSGKENDAHTYIFTIHATSDEIEKFYASEMTKLGWTLLATGGGENSNVLMIFTGPKGTLSISILIVDQEESLMYVMISEP